MNNDDVELECLVLGPESSGKTFLIRKLCALATNDCKTLSNDATTPTIGQDVVTITGTNDVEIKIREIGGKMGSGWTSYIKYCTSILFCIDISDPSMLATSFIQFQELLSHEDIQNKNIMLVLGKIDVIDSISLRIYLNVFKIDELILQMGSKVDTIHGSSYDHAFVNAVLVWIKVNNS
jgi:GTPase SAR1 family protein